MLERKFPPKFFSFPTQKFHISQSHKVFTQNSLIFSLSLTRPLSLSLTHTHTQPRQRRRAEPDPAQQRRQWGRAQPSTPLLPYPSALSPSPQDPFSLSPYTTPHTHSFFLTIPIPIPILLGKLFVWFFVLIVVKFWVWIWILNIRLFI